LKGIKKNIKFSASLFRLLTFFSFVVDEQKKSIKTKNDDAKEESQVRLRPGAPD